MRQRLQRLRAWARTAPWFSKLFPVAAWVSIYASTTGMLLHLVTGHWLAAGWALGSGIWTTVALLAMRVAVQAQQALVNRGMPSFGLDEDGGVAVNVQLSGTATPEIVPHVLREMADRLEAEQASMRTVH